MLLHIFTDLHGCRTFEYQQLFKVFFAFTIFLIKNTVHKHRHKTVSNNNWTQKGPASCRLSQLHLMVVDADSSGSAAQLWLTCDSGLCLEVGFQHCQKKSLAGRYISERTQGGMMICLLDTAGCSCTL
jgi:hypothetical protein